jgi:hypothetical protein
LACGPDDKHHQGTPDTGKQDKTSTSDVVGEHDTGENTADLDRGWETFLSAV